MGKRKKKKKKPETEKPERPSVEPVADQPDLSALDSPSTSPLASTSAVQAASSQLSSGQSMTTSAAEKNTANVNATNAPTAHPRRFTRYVSFALLLAIIVVLGIFFYQVMSRFIVPLFLSALLVVIFRPLHQKIHQRVGGRDQLAAGLTTLSILLAVLVPLAGLVFLAATEGKDLMQQFNSAKIIDDISHVRTNLGLDMPSAREFRQVETKLASSFSKTIADRDELENQSTSLFEVTEETISIARQQDLPWPVQPPQPPADDDPNVVAETEVQVDPDKPVLQQKWEAYVIHLQETKALQRDIADLVRQSDSEFDPESSAEINGQKHAKIHQYQKTVGLTATSFLDFKYQLLGGRSKAMVVEAVNPSSTELKSRTDEALNYLSDSLLALGGSISAFLGNMAFGGVIMVIGLYFFLLDGPGMVEALKGLSPIDDEHEQELVSEFGRVSRAVVVATLLSALVQGLLAGLGFWVCGLESIFMLTLLSAVLAMVPFVGAAAVWIPCALYLYFIENNLTAAIGLAIYGAAVISMADNLIKPWILHGQSNLHPLLALLSVLGGVAVLGPIGILIGPMIVAFLQTLLKILQREMNMLDLQSAQDANNATSGSSSPRVALASGGGTDSPAAST